MRVVVVIPDTNDICSILDSELKVKSVEMKFKLRLLVLKFREKEDEVVWEFEEAVLRLDSIVDDFNKPVIVVVVTVEVVVGIRVVVVANLVVLAFVVVGIVFGRTAAEYN